MEKNITCPVTARELARYYEGEARRLNQLAASLETGAVLSIERVRKLFKAGQLAKAMIDDGTPDRMAIGEVSRQLDLPAQTVAAQLEFHSRKKAVKAKTELKNEVVSLHNKGQSYRQIARRTGISKSYAFKLVKTTDGPGV